MPEKTFAVNFKTSGFKKAASQMSDVSDEADEAGSSVNKAGELAKKGIAVMTTAITGAVAGMGALISRTTEYARQVDNAAEQSGLAAERIQEIAFAAKQTSGTNFDSVRDGLKELAIRSEEAAQGTGEAAEAFDRLGVSQEFLQDASTAEVFRRVRQELQGASKSMRIFAAETIFGGEAGERLVETLGLSNEEMERLSQQARESGAVLSGSQVQALERTRQAWTSLTSSVVGFGRQIAARMAPIVTGTVIPALRSMARGVRDTVRAITTMSDTTKGIIALVTGLTAAISAGIAIWAGWPAIIAGVTAAFSALSTAATTAWAAITSPITGVIAAIAAVAGIVGLIYDNWSGLTDFFRQTFESVKALASTFGTLLKETFASAWTEVKAVFLNALDGLIQIINDGLRAIGAEGMTIDASFGMDEEVVEEQRQQLSSAVTAFQNAGSGAASAFTAEISDGWSAVRQSTSDAVSWVSNQVTQLGSMFSFGGGSGMFGGGSFGGGGAGGSFGAGGGQQGSGSQGSEGPGGFFASEGWQQTAQWIRRTRKEMQRTRKAGLGLSNTLENGFRQVASGIGQATTELFKGGDAARAFARTAKRALEQVIQKIIQAIVTQKILSGLFSAIGGPLSGLFGGASSGAVVPTGGVVPGLAAGGGAPTAAAVQGGQPTFRGGSIRIPLQMISQGKTKGDALRAQTGRSVG